MSKPKLFIGSSTEGLKYARALQQNLHNSGEIFPRSWKQGIFQSGNAYLESLLAALDDVDFGAFIFSPDDVTILRDEESRTIRDNVLFELGMFMGRLGRHRSFFIKPQGQRLHLPSDLDGVIALDYNDDTNLQAAIGAASDAILSRVAELGSKTAAGTAVSPAPVTYDREEAFRRQIEVAAPQRKPLVRCSTYIRTDTILPNGDVRVTEHFERLEPLSETPLPEIPSYFRSRAGRAADPRCESLTEGQDVKWAWVNYDAREDRWDGLTRFIPPLAKGRPITYEMETAILNGVTFTRQERLDTLQQDPEESIRRPFRHVVDSCAMQVVFPEGRFPQKTRVLARPIGGEIDAAETAFAGRFLTAFRATRTLVFNIAQPLPGFLYEIRWELPEETLLAFDEVQGGFVEEMTRRLLALRSVSPVHTEPVRQALASLRAGLIAAFACESEPFEITLYVYDRQRGGLACVVSLDAPLVELNFVSHLFKPGRGVCGRAFRNREVEKYPPPSGSADFYEHVEQEDPATRPCAIICIPLFHMGIRSRSVGVVSFATRVRTSSLTALVWDQAKASAVAQAMEGWYGGALAEALGVIPSRRFWASEAATVGSS